MTVFLCKLWPYLAGGLIGWLLAGWLARRLKHSAPPIEKIIEKEVEIDNPKHLSLISKLENENRKIPDLVSKISLFENSKPKVEIKEVEKIVKEIVEVDSPILISRIKDLEAKNTENSDLKGKLSLLRTELVNAKNAKGKIVEVDSPKLLSRIEELEIENKQIVDLEGKLQRLEGAKPREKIVEVDNPRLLAEIKILKSKLLASNQKVSSATPGIQSLINSTSAIPTLRDSSENNDSASQKRIQALETEISPLKGAEKIDLAAAKSAGIRIKHGNDLTIIEGVGPKIDDLIKAEGITTFHALADSNPSTLQHMLDKAGSSYKIANPSTWPDQANLAANNRWTELKILQDVLVGGVYPDEATSNKTASNQSDSQKSHKQLSKQNIDAQKAAGFNIRQNSNGYDDFTIVEGIGPKINGLIHDAGIHTYEELGDTLVDDIQTVLDDAGSSYKFAKPGTWPAQADMAAENRWEALKNWQSELNGGQE